MKNIIWKKLSIFKKFIFCLGWFAVFSPGFWIALIIHNNLTQQDKFWTPGSFRVVFVFGWIHFILILFVLIGSSFAR